MKRMFIFALITIFLFSSLLISQGNDKKVKIMSIQAPVIANFENPAVKEKWIIGEFSPNMDADIAKVQIMDGGPWGLAVPDEEKKFCLGVKTAFKTRGYNYMEVLPPVFDMALYPEFKTLFPTDIPNPEQERFIPIPGRCKSIDVWVSGRNYRYRLEVWLKDYNGFIYSLDMGSVEYAGWRNLSKALPDYVPQEEKYYPREKPLKFIKYLIRSEPDERASIFFIYFDHMKVITDVYIERFDGDDIKDKW